MLIYPTYEELYKPEIKRVMNINPSNKARLDTWIEIGKQDGYLKMSHFGEIETGNKMRVKDFIYTRFDGDGKIQDFTSSITSYGYINGGTPSVYPWNYVNPNGINELINSHKNNKSQFPEVNLRELYSKVVNNTHLIDNEAMPINSELFEDTMNLPFQIYGYILAAFSAIAMHIPYTALVIIDSSYGFNILDIQEQKGSNMRRNVVRNSVKKFLDFMCDINKGFRELCRNEEATVRAYGYVYPFGAMIEIFHRELGNISFRNHINISDHCRILRTIESRDQSSYFNSPLFEALNKSGYPSAISSMFSSSDEREGFYKGYITENFISDWRGGNKTWQRKTPF